MAELVKITMTEVHKNLMKTRQFQQDIVNMVVDKYLGDLKTGNINIPSVQSLAEEYPEYAESMIRLYDGTFGLFDHVDEIPNAIKIAQAAVIDSFCYFYNVGDNTLGGICTLNTVILGQESILDQKVLKKAFTLNTEGRIHSLRVDFDFSYYSTEDVAYKTVAHKAVLDEDNIVLVPYVAGYRFCRLIAGFLEKEFIIGVKQTLGDGSSKVRLITECQKHLTNYCDDPKACEGLTSEYYPTQGYFYAPVLGAPSTTAMKTRINIFYVSNITRITSYEKCRSLGIQKCKDPIKELCLETAILSTMGDLKIKNPDKYDEVISKLPDVGIMGESFNGDVGILNLSNYLHTATQGIKTKMLKLIPGAQHALDVRLAVTSGSPDSSLTVTADNLRQLARTGVLKIVWKKSNGMYSSTIGTNSPEILRKVYGKDYMGNYESFGVRIRNMEDEMEALGMPLDIALEQYGFDKSIAPQVKERLQSGENIESAMYGVMGKKKRASSSNPNLFTIRSLAAYLSGDYSNGSVVPKANDYYSSVDISHIMRAEVVGMYDENIINSMESSEEKEEAVLVEKAEIQSIDAALVTRLELLSDSSKPSLEGGVTIIGKTDLEEGKRYNVADIKPANPSYVKKLSNTIILDGIIQQDAPSSKLKTAIRRLIKRRADHLNGFCDFEVYKLEIVEATKFIRVFSHVWDFTEKDWIGCGRRLVRFEDLRPDSEEYLGKELYQLIYLVNSELRMEPRSIELVTVGGKSIIGILLKSDRG